MKEFEEVVIPRIEKKFNVYKEQCDLKFKELGDELGDELEQAKSIISDLSYLNSAALDKYKLN